MVESLSLKLSLKLSLSLPFFFLFSPSSPPLPSHRLVQDGPSWMSTHSTCQPRISSFGLPYLFIHLLWIFTQLWISTCLLRVPLEPFVLLSTHLTRGTLRATHHMPSVPHYSRCLENREISTISEFNKIRHGS